MQVRAVGTRQSKTTGGLRKPPPDPAVQADVGPARALRGARHRSLAMQAPSLAEGSAPSQRDAPAWHDTERAQAQEPLSRRQRRMADAFEVRERESHLMRQDEPLP